MTDVVAPVSAPVPSVGVEEILAMEKSIFKVAEAIVTCVKTPTLAGIVGSLTSLALDADVLAFVKGVGSLAPEFKDLSIEEGTTLIVELVKQVPVLVSSIKK